VHVKGVSRLLFLAATVASGIVFSCVGDQSEIVPVPEDSGAVADATPAADTGGSSSGDAQGPQDSGADGETMSGMDANAGDGSSGPWTPAKLTGLAIWLDGARGLTFGAGTNVTQWADQSGNQNFAATKSAAGTIVAEALDGGVNRMHFAAGQMEIADDKTIQWGAANDVVIAVVGGFTNTSSGYIYEKLTAFDAGGDAFGLTLNGGAVSKSFCVGNDYQLLTTATGGPFNDGAARVMTLRRLNSGATLEARVNGVVTSGTVTAYDVSSPGKPAHLGTPSFGGQQLSGTISELVAVSHVTISDQDVGALESYLAAKYGIALQADAGAH
jgi:hypothetical protein